jgi:tetratricopeptide (TPR) repeat protein
MFVDNAVRGDDPRLAAVYANYRANLRGIIDAASGAGAKTVLCTVVANLKDCAPFLSLHSPGLSQQDLAAWTAAFDSGRLAWRLGDAALARARLTEAERLDPQYADTLFMLGSLDLQLGDTAAARSHFVGALHWDALRFRPDPAIGQVAREVARERSGNVTLLDTADALGSELSSAQPLSGREILFEHVHFDWDGSFQIGRMMARACGSALFGQDSVETGWMDNAACARALAYTAHERLPMLLRIDVLERKPPFTNQLTHVGDEARMARAIEAASGAARNPAVLAAAADEASEALVRDPGNPALAGILEGIKQDQGDLAGALALARRAEERLPRDYAVVADEASLLVRLGKYDEALRLLTQSARTDADLDLLGPVFVELWTQTRRFGEALDYLGKAIQLHPADLRLRVVRAGVLRASGDGAAAEREFRAILAADPSNEDALEAIVGILEQSGRRDEAARMSMAAAAGQPRNQANSIRAAQACAAIGDTAGELQDLLAAEKSGPVTATFELTLALKLYKMGRGDALMEHLAEAKALSLFEGNPAVTESIGVLIERMRGETGLPQ